MSGFALPERYEPTATVLTGGGMSDAAVCRDRHLDRLVVIKSLKPNEEPQRLLDELAALQEIRSKHVVQIYDIIRGHSGDIRAIVEEYLPGPDLFEIELPQSVDEFLKVLYPIAEGIADIHGHGRVHRDIKPNNMKFDDERTLKIFDFGLSRMDADGITANIVVTPGFAAPELFKENRVGKVEFTQAVDVFAFGVTALFLATGDIPAHLQALPPTLPAYDMDFNQTLKVIPEEIVKLLTACLEVAPTKRPKMLEIRNVLARYLLKERHRALLVFKQHRYILDTANRVVNLRSQSLGSLRVSYDGQNFLVSNVAGYVSVNNRRIFDGFILQGSCVIILGSPDKGIRRVFVTFDVAHPEVTL